LASIVLISEPDDPRVAVYRQVRERDLAGREGGFIAEGEVVLRVLLGGGALCRPDSLLIAAKRLPTLTPLLGSLPEDVPVYAAGQAVMDAVVGFPIHRGIMAYGRRPRGFDAAGLLGHVGRAGALVLVLFGISNHDNMGGLFRNAAAFGADAVLLDATCCDPLYRKAIRVSVGAALKVPFARFGHEVDPLGLLESAGFTALALSPGGEQAVATLTRPGRAAILLGAEGPGLPPDLLKRARTVTIPMAPGWDSLNVATASAIVLHQLTCGGAGPGDS
jgi:tRNA G18 (ribose-2'-O)-methylase SpoU